MKKLKNIILIIVIILPLLLLCDWIYYGKRYNTINEAIMKTENIKEVIAVLEDGKYAMGLFMKIDDNDPGVENIYLRKDEKGWKVLYSKIFYFQKFKFMDDGSILCWYKDGKNYLINISKVSKIYEEEIVPKDSIGSEFKYFSKNSGDTRLSEWFVAVEDLPKDYTITIKDKEYKIK